MQNRKIWLILPILLLNFILPLPVQAYDVIEVKDGGILEGKVIFKGTVPPIKDAIITKDKEACDKDGTGVKKISPIRLSSEGGVLNVIILLNGITQGKDWPKQEGIAFIDNKDCEFRPYVQVVPIGVDFEVVNSDPVLHNTHSYIEKRTVFNLALPNQGMRIKKAMPKKPDLVRFECDAHGWMLGWVHAADNPYYSVTNEGGAFKIESIPPGTYKVKIWQEYVGTKEQEVTIEAGKTTQLNIELTK
jgi:hypothetical protein